MTDQETAITTVQEDNNSQALNAVRNTGGQLATLPDPAILKERLARAAEYRELINNHIKSTFRKWDHYYKYHFKKDCKVYRCQDPYHISPNWEITASGAKKLLEDFTFFPDYKTDEDTKRNFTDTAGLVCLICIIYTLEGKFYASGRGSARTGPYSDENRTVKMAQKSALIDALKSSGLIADFEQIIQEKEGEIKTTVSSSNTSAVKPEPVNQPLQATPPTTTQASAKWCDDCPAPGPYHAGYCPNFKAPQTVQTGEIIE